MFKFLRKYNKWILAVGGTLLMIVFLMPYAMTQWIQQIGAQGAARGTVGDGEEISASAWSTVNREYAIVSRIPGGTILPWGGEIDNEKYWYLLTREAEQAGLVASYDLTNEELSQMRSVLNISESGAVLEATMAKAAGINEMFGLYQGSGKLSDRRLRDIARRRFHSADAEMIVIRADGEKAADVEPTEPQIAEQMAKFAEEAPGAGEHGFGYRLPDRVKIEWLAIDGESIEQAVRNDESVFNSIAQRRYWRAHENDAGMPLIATSDVTTVPLVVQEGLLNELVAERAAAISNALSGILSNAERVFDGNRRNGVVVLPADWAARRLSLEDAAERLRKQFPGIAIEYHARGDEWVPVDELVSLEGIGLASTAKFGTARRLGQLVAAMREFDPATSLPLQVGLAMPVLEGVGNTLYLPRIIAAEKSRAPKSVDEVRDDVVRDLRRLSHFDQLTARASEYEQLAEHEGLVAASLELGAAVQGRTQVGLTNRPLLQMQLAQGQFPLAGPAPVPALGLAVDATGKIIDHALTLPQDVPTADLPIEDRVFTVTADEALALIIVKLVDQQPLTENLYRQLTGSAQLQGLVARDELETGQLLADAFSYEKLAARHNLKLEDRSIEDELDDEAPDESALASGSSE